MIQQHKLHALPLIIGINTSRPSAPTATPIPIRVPPIEVGQGRPPKTLTHLPGRLPIPHTPPPPPPPPRLRHRSRHRLQTEPPSVSSNQGANVVPPPPTPPPQSPPTPTPPSPPARRPGTPSPPIQPRRRRRVQLPDRGRRRVQHQHGRAVVSSIRAEADVATNPTPATLSRGTPASRSRPSSALYITALHHQRAKS
ncbi:hypothetical protein SETIT_2G332800v2 [Setaria italica]|uniref:Uncharacterized protein n=1 Tax=Setaria italica TaxID=4555 RepID=A0A368Q623_SETIT|nr:hypothetical protein SETIT_2G332800v2 [Setaria italica]